MRGTKARKIRRMALQYSIIAKEKVGVNRLNNMRHKNTQNHSPSFLKYSGYPRVYRDMKKSYTEGTMKI